ncbi:hypothetical protein [Acidithiobacillus marinus]|nr:hypothetical protein [Acidithiobacillus marinus]
MDTFLITHSRLNAQQATTSASPPTPAANNAPPTRPPTGQAETAAKKPVSTLSVPPEKLQKAIQKLQDKMPASASVTLEAGLDPNGDHPGQVLIKLSDKVTKQIFFQYYVPAEQVVRSADSGEALNPGSLMRSKA